mmetsp:Transcript_14808/g.32110  ORF Transcript_14808/g.32110 Transcript_14808/m.32110 type:complete len:254 (+) Transcript_14808:238-999(+)
MLGERPRRCPLFFCFSRVLLVVILIDNDGTRKDCCGIDASSNLNLIRVQIFDELGAAPHASDGVPPARLKSVSTVEEGALRVKIRKGVHVAFVVELVFRSGRKPFALNLCEQLVAVAAVDIIAGRCCKYPPLNGAELGSMCIAKAKLVDHPPAQVDVRTINLHDSLASNVTHAKVFAREREHLLLQHVRAWSVAHKCRQKRPLIRRLGLQALVEEIAENVCARHSKPKRARRPWYPCDWCQRLRQQHSSDSHL